jgi:hypothetical protein
MSVSVPPLDLRPKGFWTKALGLTLSNSQPLIHQIELTWRSTPVPDTIIYFRLPKPPQISHAVSSIWLKTLFKCMRESFELSSGPKSHLEMVHYAKKVS